MQKLFDTRAAALALAGLLLAVLCAVPSAVATKGAEASSASGLAVAQFSGPIKDRWLNRLRATGVRIVTYSGENAYIVHGSAHALKRAAALHGEEPALRAVTRYEPNDKLAPQIANGGRVTVAVQTVSGETGAQARGRVAAAGAEIRADSSVAGLRTQFVRLDRGDLDALVADAGVVAVEPYSPPRLLDERAEQIVAGNLTGSVPSGPGYLSWLAGKGFDGTLFPFAIDVTDEGLDGGGLDDSSTFPPHPDFYLDGVKPGTSRVAYVHNETNDSNGRDCGGHGTNVASIAAGFNDGATSDVEDADGYQYGLGIAPAAQVGASKIFRCSGNFDLQGTFTTLTSQAYAAGARVSNNSWGSNTAGGYGSDSRNYDALVRDAQPGVPGNQQMVEVFAAGNEGPGDQTVGSPATGKNVIAVGASENVRGGGDEEFCDVTDADADDSTDVAWFSSRGPTGDQRMKPDLVAPGTHVTGASPQHAGYQGDGTCDPMFPAGNTLYSRVSGTSQATPEVTGAAAMVTDWWRRTRGGGSTLPSPAMVKAILVNSATDLAGGSDGDGGTLAPVPSEDQGWGRANLGSAFDDTVRRYRDQSDELSATGQSFARSYDVADTGRPPRVTLVWTDSPGPLTGATLVNNLDLSVTVAGQTYKGNVFSGGQSVPGGNADAANNVENVFLPAGIGGPIDVQVTGANVPGDGVPGDGDLTDQDFALVVSNAQSAAGSNEEPIASFVTDPDPGAVLPGEGVAFDASASLDLDGTITDYSWDFDDGTILPNGGPTPPHTYISAGLYTATLTVTDDDGAVDTTQEQIKAEVGPPVADFSVSPDSAQTGQSIDFDASASSDPDGPVADYAWDFDDGSAVVHTASPTIAHSYSSAGVRTVELTVTDEQSSTATAQATVTVSKSAEPLLPPPPAPPLLDSVLPPVEPILSVAPRVRIARRTLRITSTGTVRLLLSCPNGASRCNGAVKLSASIDSGSVTSRESTIIGTGAFKIAGGKTRAVAVRLRRQARLALTTVKRLKAKAAIVARDAAGNRRSRSVRITLLAPR
ncbi:MAG: S8 family serine peptidase [Phycisphaeraceae bacterium]